MTDARRAPFAELLRVHRLAARLTQEELAERAGLSVRGISDLERGLRRVPHRETVELLIEALGLQPDERGVLLASVERRRGPVAERRVPYDAPRGGTAELPAPATSFVARERERGELRALLGDKSLRLLTLSGPGGAGKTRLALAVAEDCRQAFPGGVAYLPLAAVRDPALVLGTLAEALGVMPIEGQHLLASLRQQLRDQRRLLLLENVEQALAAAPVLGELLAACPSLTLLATSRAPLRLTGERLYPVAPLPLDDAVRLFAERARAARNGFVVTRANEPAIRAICRRLDCLPLALELAAARCGILAPAALLDRLTPALPLLTAGPCDVPARQQTLRASIAWSYGLLSAGEQRLLLRLVAFAGGFTFDAAEGIVSEIDGRPAAEAVLHELTGLVEHNLVQAQAAAESDDPVRFSVLATVREFALEQAAQQPELAGLRRAHARFFACWAERERQHQEDQQSMESLERMAAEQENLRAALEWAIEQDDRRLVLRLAAATALFWLVRGLPREDGDQTGEFLRVASNPERIGELGQVLSTIASSAGDRHEVGRALVTLGLLGRAGGAGSTQSLTQALALFRALGDDRWTGLTLGVLGGWAIEQGDYRAARVRLEEALAAGDRAGHAWGAAAALRGLGELAEIDGNHRQAAVRFRESLLAFAQAGDNRGAVAVLDDLARVLIHGGWAAPGVRFPSAAEVLRDECGGPVSLRHHAAHQAALDRARALLGHVRLDEIWRAGQRLSLADVATEAAAVPPIATIGERAELAP